MDIVPAERDHLFAGESPVYAGGEKGWGAGLGLLREERAGCKAYPVMK